MATPRIGYSGANLADLLRPGVNQSEYKDALRLAEQYCLRVKHHDVALAWRAGVALLRIKRMIIRGKWTAWQKEAEFASDRKIAMYMRIAKEFDTAEDAAAKSAGSVVKADEIALARQKASKAGISLIPPSPPFDSERDLQRALRPNITKLEPGLLIVDGGREKDVPDGRIDITARDTKGSLVVIELKIATAEDLTQLLAYMGAIENPSRRTVRGILVAYDFSPRVVHAAKVVSQITLKAYRYSSGQFSFQERLTSQHLRLTHRGTQPCVPTSSDWLLPRKRKLMPLNS